MPTTIIIDANSLIARAIMGSVLDDLKIGGRLTGGVYGSLTSLRTFIAQPGLFAGPIFAFFDCGIPPKRLEALPSYEDDRKERRKKNKMLTEEDRERAFLQLGPVRDMFRLLGVVCTAYRDREADDCVAAAARIMTHGQTQAPVVWSTDRDLLQCVRYGARVYNGSAWIEQENFRQVVGVPMGSYLVYKALVGDISDSIKGAAGCGEKRAAALIKALQEDLYGLTAHKQLDVIGEAVRGLDKRLKYEQAILDDLDRLHRVLDGIDLQDSFGGTGGLARRLEDRPVVDRKGFLRFCKREGLRSVLGSPNEFLGPFEKAMERRTA